MENVLKMEEKKKRKFRFKIVNRWFVDLGDIFFFLVREWIVEFKLNIEGNSGRGENRDNKI